jgi:DNA processing protein
MNAGDDTVSASQSPREARACDRCLAGAWLIGELGGHLETARGRISQVLALGDDELIAAAGHDRAESLHAGLAEFDAGAARERSAAAGLEPICRCDPGYPRRLRALEAPPGVLHVAGGLDRFLTLVADEPVAIVGARRASPYGIDVARALGRGLAGAGLAVISGMALGIDSAAHAGAIAANGPTIAVLPCGPDIVYPRSKRRLHGQIQETGSLVSELPPGAHAWRWTFPARNRIIAGLAAMTIVVEAGERSGALVTVAFARSLGRPIGAVPGRITSPLSRGPNALLAGGAHVVRGPQDVLDHLFGAGVRSVHAGTHRDLAPELRALLAAIADGYETGVALERAGLAPQQGLAALASLELAGYVRREPGGRFAVRA